MHSQQSTETGWGQWMPAAAGVLEAGSDQHSQPRAASLHHLRQSQHQHGTSRRSRRSPGRVDCGQDLGACVGQGLGYGWRGRTDHHRAAMRDGGMQA